MGKKSCTVSLKLVLVIAVSLSMAVFLCMRIPGLSMMGPRPWPASPTHLGTTRSHSFTEELVPVGPSNGNKRENRTTASSGSVHVLPYNQSASGSSSKSLLQLGTHGHTKMAGLIGLGDSRAHCCNLVAGRFLEDVCGHKGVIQVTTFAKGVKAEKCTCVDFLYCKLVVVTAFSSNHYEEAQDMIASVQHFLPNTKLIVYDLGMTDGQKRNVSHYCNVKLRTFSFERYPPHTKELKTYAWKPIIVDEVSQEYEVILWGDSSMRVMAPIVHKVLPLLLKFPFVGGSSKKLPIISLTHDGMIHYLNVTHSRRQLGSFGHIEANCWLMWVNSVMRKKFLEYWADCAFHEECIAPAGSNLKCDITLLRKLQRSRIQGGQYIDCHRYDQSAMNLILIREFGVKVWRTVVHKETWGVLTVARKVTNYYHNIIKNYCNVGYHRI